MENFINEKLVWNLCLSVQAAGLAGTTGDADTLTVRTSSLPSCFN